MSKCCSKCVGQSVHKAIRGALLPSALLSSDGLRPWVRVGVVSVGGTPCQRHPVRNSTWRAGHSPAFHRLLLATAPLTYYTSRLRRPVQHRDSAPDEGRRVNEGGTAGPGRAGFLAADHRLRIFPRPRARASPDYNVRARELFTLDAPMGGEPAWGRWVLSSKDRIVTDRDARRTRRGCGCSRCCRVDHHASHAHVVVEHVRMRRVFPIDAFSGVPRRRSVVRMSRAGEVPARIQAAQRCCAAGTRVEGSGHPITRLRFTRGLQRCSYMLGAGLSLASDAPSTACQQHRWVRTPRSVEGYAETNLVRFG